MRPAMAPQLAPTMGESPVSIKSKSNSALRFVPSVGIGFGSAGRSPGWLRTCSAEENFEVNLLL